MNSNRKLVYAYHSLLWPLVGLVALIGFSMLAKINTPELREQIGQDYLL
ncbi:MAG: hypothetical protein GXP05_14745 [Alphaproteobacteria bacterium]|nr:hypothetical protein [Alphaproteobacteria bacterium]